MSAFDGVGEMDMKNNFTEEALSHWRMMLRKCYATEWPRLPHEDYHVAPEWHRFSQFNKWFSQFDFTLIKGRRLVIDFSLDQEKEYGPDTCLFVTPLLFHFLRSRLRIVEKFEDFVSLSITSDGFFKPDIDGLFKSDIELKLEWCFESPTTIRSYDYDSLAQVYRNKVYVTMYQESIKIFNTFLERETLPEVTEALSRLISNRRLNAKEAKTRLKKEIEEDLS